MALKAKLQEDLKTALRSRDALGVGTIRLLLAAIINKEKEALRQAQGKGKELSDEEIESVVATEAKKRREATEAFLKGKRTELADKETKELRVLLSYLPAQLAEDEIRTLVKEAIVSLREMSRLPAGGVPKGHRDTKTGALGPQDMGKVMGVLAPQIKGRADGAQVSSMVKEFLTSQ